MPRKKNESVAEEELKSNRGGKYKPKFDAEEPAEPFDPKKVRADLQKVSAEGDLVDIWERRLLNPNHQESQPIRIKTKGMRLRWINLSNRGRFQRARYEQGWVPVHKDELMDEREIFGASFTTEGYVCRGEKQGEMLMKMPEAVYKQIQKRRDDMNRQSYAKLKDNLASAGHQHFKDAHGGNAGDVAAEAASKFVGSVKFGTERATTDELM
jgi:hypothetical protein